MPDGQRACPDLAIQLVYCISLWRDLRERLKKKNILAIQIMRKSLEIMKSVKRETHKKTCARALKFWDWQRKIQITCESFEVLRLTEKNSNYTQEIWSFGADREKDPLTRSLPYKNLKLPQDRKINLHRIQSSKSDHQRGTDQFL